jgi:hypothetical protein
VCSAQDREAEGHLLTLQHYCSTVS